jgi:hypothetical protein
MAQGAVRIDTLGPVNSEQRDLVRFDPLRRRNASGPAGVRRGRGRSSGAGACTQTVPGRARSGRASAAGRLDRHWSSARGRRARGARHAATGPRSAPRHPHDDRRGGVLRLRPHARPADRRHRSFLQSRRRHPGRSGHGNGCRSAGGYLRHYGAFHGDRARFAQGAETGRPSELEIELRGDEVVLRGEAVVAAAGTLQLPAA